MKYNILALFISIFLIGCYSNHSPEVVIPNEDPPIGMEKMSDILVDIHLAQSSIKELQIKRINIDGTAEEYHYLIFQKHGVSKEDFDKSVEYYNYRVEDLNLIYEEVITKLSLMDSELKSIQADTINE